MKSKTTLAKLTILIGLFTFAVTTVTAAPAGPVITIDNSNTTPRPCSLI